MSTVARYESILPEFKKPTTYAELQRRAKQIPRVSTNPATIRAITPGVLGQLERGEFHD